MKHADLLNLSLGLSKTIRVGQIPLFIASVYEAHTIEIRFARERLLHIAQFHPDMFPDHILLLGDAISKGLIIRDNNRIKHLSCCFQHPSNEKIRFIAGLKFALSNHELWVSTFHRSSDRQTKSMLANGRALRKHL